MALGKIKADTLEHSTAGSVDTQFVVNGSAKSWASATISSNTHTLQDSLNVSSLTDDGAGRTDIVFSSNMSNANYSATSMCAISGDELFAHFGAGSLVLTNEFRCQTTTDANSTTDYDKLCATVHGDLA